MIWKLKYSRSIGWELKLKKRIKNWWVNCKVLEGVIVSLNSQRQIRREHFIMLIIRMIRSWYNLWVINCKRIRKKFKIWRMFLFRDNSKKRSFSSRNSSSDSRDKKSHQNPCLIIADGRGVKVLMKIEKESRIQQNSELNWSNTVGTIKWEKATTTILVMQLLTKPTITHQKMIKNIRNLVKKYHQ